MFDIVWIVMCVQFNTFKIFKKIASEMPIPHSPGKPFLTVKHYKDKEPFRANSVSYVRSKYCLSREKIVQERENVFQDQVLKQDNSTYSKIIALISKLKL